MCEGVGGVPFDSMPMLIQWLVTDTGWKEVGDETMHEAFTVAFLEREAQQLSEHEVDLYYNSYPVQWIERFEYAVDFRAMAMRNLDTGMTQRIRMQIHVNTFEEACALLSVPRIRWESAAGGEPSAAPGERWSTARSSA